MIVLSIFGTTRGLEVVNFPTSKEPLPCKLESHWVEIPPNDVSLQFDQDCIYVHRQNISGNTITWIGIYQRALEIGYDRPGSFIGAGAWLINSVINADQLIPVLKNLLTQAKSKTTTNNRFTKKIEEVQSQFQFPAVINSLLQQQQTPSLGLVPYSTLSFSTTQDDAVRAVNWAQHSRGAEYFNAGYIGASNLFATQQNTTKKIIRISNTSEIDERYEKLQSDLVNQVKKLTEETSRLKVDLDIKNSQLNEQNEKLKKDSQLLTSIQTENQQISFNLQKLNSEKNQLEQQLKQIQTRVGSQNQPQPIQSQQQKVNTYPALQGNNQVKQSINPSTPTSSAFQKPVIKSKPTSGSVNKSIELKKKDHSVLWMSIVIVILLFICFLLYFKPIITWPFSSNSNEVHSTSATSPLPFENTGTPSNKTEAPQIKSECKLTYRDYKVTLKEPLKASEVDQATKKILEIFKLSKNTDDACSDKISGFSNVISNALNNNSKKNSIKVSIPDSLISTNDKDISSHEISSKVTLELIKAKPDTDR